MNLSKNVEFKKNSLVNANEASTRTTTTKRFILEYKKKLCDLISLSMRYNLRGSIVSFLC